jgi:AraC-like DNA-binding protein
MARNSPHNRVEKSNAARKGGIGQLGVSAIYRSRNGEPLSLNRAPAPDLAPWVARLIATKIKTPDGGRVDCYACNDTPYIRSVYGSDWKARSVGSAGSKCQKTFLFGPHSKRMTVSFEGEVWIAGIALKPGALCVLASLPANEAVDQIYPTSRIGIAEDAFGGLFEQSDKPEDWLLGMEQVLRDHIDRTWPSIPDEISSAFDLAAFADPNISVSDFAKSQGLGVRQLERIVKRDFGLTPKQVLRRARALDLAAQLCGVADEAEEAELQLRYSDQSHLIKEFTSFFNMTPRQLTSQRRPLLASNLETRQARRLEELHRIEPGELRPWQA